MRLIDADVLKMRLSDFDWYPFNKISKDKLLSILNNTPTVEMRESGEWIKLNSDNTELCECSVCHEKYKLYEEHVLDRNFCPNCGADMRGKWELLLNSYFTWE